MIGSKHPALLHRRGGSLYHDNRLFAYREFCDDSSLLLITEAEAPPVVARRGRSWCWFNHDIRFQIPELCPIMRKICFQSTVVELGCLGTLRRVCVHKNTYFEEFRYYIRPSMSCVVRCWVRILFST